MKLLPIKKIIRSPLENIKVL